MFNITYLTGHQKIDSRNKLEKLQVLVPFMIVAYTLHNPFCFCRNQFYQLNDQYVNLQT